MKKAAIIALLLLAGLAGLMATFPEDATRVAFSVERFRSGLADKTATVDGETWHYLDGGPVDAPVIVLLHGFGGDRDHWTRFSNSLTGHFRVIAPDLPGFGESARHAGWDYSLGAQRDRVRGFADALDLDQFHLGGNSMGGHLAALYTHRYPHQVLSLALFNNGGINAPEMSDMWSAVSRGENPLIISAAEDFDRMLAFASHKKPFIPWPAKSVLAQRAVENSDFNRYIFDTLMSDRDVALEPLLPDITQPVLILWGEFDRIIDVSSVDVMRPLLPQAKVVIMKETGHVPMAERPAQTADHYRDFLQQLQKGH